MFWQKDSSKTRAVWLFGRIACKLWVPLDVMLCTASILIFRCINLDRYYAITRPLAYAVKRSADLALIMIGLVWLASALITCTPIFGYNDHPQNDTNWEYMDNQRYVIYSALVNMALKDAAATGAQEMESSESSSSADFSAAFHAYSMFGDRLSDGTSICLKNIDKWLEQADILDGKSVTNADTAITFAKIAGTAKRMEQSEFVAFLEDLAEEKGMRMEDLMDKLVKEREPGLCDVTTTVSGAARASVERLTDHRLYTGSHRERFDDEGRGRGLEGRFDVVPADGYVTGFKRKEEEEEK